MDVHDLESEPDIKLVQSADKCTFWLQMSNPTPIDSEFFLMSLEVWLHECVNAMNEKYQVDEADH